MLAYNFRWGCFHCWCLKKIKWSSWHNISIPLELSWKILQLPVTWPHPQYQATNTKLTIVPEFSNSITKYRYSNYWSRTRIWCGMLWQKHPINHWPQLLQKLDMVNSIPVGDSTTVLFQMNTWVCLWPDQSLQTYMVQTLSSFNRIGKDCSYLVPEFFQGYLQDLHL